jgi:hypothetical protein
MSAVDNSFYNGKLYKRTGTDEIYYYDLNSLRYIPDVNTLNGVFNAAIHSSAALDAKFDGVTKGNPIVSGSYLGKADNNDTVYFMDEPQGQLQKRAISNENVFHACGFKQSMISSLPWLTVSGISDGPQITMGLDDDGNPIT